MKEKKRLWVMTAMVVICFHLESWGQNTVTNIPNGWKVNGQEVRNGMITGIADQSEVVLTPTKADLRRVKTIKVEKISPWQGMELDLSKASVDHIGWVIARNGKIYPHVMAAKSDKTIPVAMIAYVGSEPNGRHGLAIALEDVGNGRFTWNEASVAVSQWSSSYSVSGATWRMPTVNDLMNMNGKEKRLFQLISESGGQPVQYEFYWTTNENEQGLGGSFFFNSNVIQYGNKTHSFCVRAVLEF